jgi:hypothetical protein
VDGGKKDSSSPSPEASDDGNGAHDGPGDGGAGVEGGEGGEAGEGGTSDASSDGAVPGDAGGDSDAGPLPGSDGGFPPPPGAVCDSSATWAAGTLLPISTASDDTLDAITPDELTIAWTAGSGSTASIEVADRAAATDPFGAPQTVAAGSFGTARAALSPDGLRLVVVDTGGQSFSELTRTSRTAPGNTFGAPATGKMANFSGVLSSGESYDDPVLSADDNAFYYSVTGGTQTVTVYRAARLLPTDTWPAGTALTKSTVLAAQGTARCRPTSISSDEQTIFFWDEITNTEKAAWIDEATGAFDGLVVDLGARAWAGPDTACDRLYYSEAGASSVDLFVASH